MIWHDNPGDAADENGIAQQCYGIARFVASLRYLQYAILDSRMHELAVTQSMVDLVLDEAKKGGAAKVKKINLVLGELSGVVGDCVQFYFGLMSKDTIAEGATVSFNTVATQAKCRQCAKVFEVKESSWVCPECHSVSVELVAGNELFVESIEVE